MKLTFDIVSQWGNLQSAGTEMCFPPDLALTELAFLTLMTEHASRLHSILDTLSQSLVDQSLFMFISESTALFFYRS